MDAKVEPPPCSSQDNSAPLRDGANLCANCFQLMSDLSRRSSGVEDWDWRFSTSSIAARYAEYLKPVNIINIIRSFLYRQDKAGIFVAELGNRFRGAIDNDCVLCQLLLASKVEIANEERMKNTTDELQAFFVKDYYLFNHGHLIGLGLRMLKLAEIKFLAVVPEDFALSSSGQDQKALELQTALKGCIILTNTKSKPTIASAITVSPHFQPSIVKEWLQFCYLNHQELCQQDSASSVTIDGFRWIDCESRNVESAPTVQPYVALSYVWGPSAPSVSYSPEVGALGQVPLLGALPAVIEDAMTVTKALGFRYLWVDRYCINQQNPDIKLKQIQQMDLIYEKAEITIVAAAGNDEQHGLPGVGGKERTSSRGASVKFKNIEITSTLKDPQNAIRASRWYTRGWTFQEGLLSRRRLIFTDEQVYFECNAMNCFESLSGSLTSLSHRDKSRAARFMRPGLFESYRSRPTSRLPLVQGVEEMDFKTLFRSYLIWSQQFSARDLRFDGDSMNAFLGLIRRVSKIPKPLLQHWAIPYPHPKYGLDPTHAFIEALSWRHKHCCWDDASRKTWQRPDFPSWSWVGWAGEIMYPTRDSELEERGVFGANEFSGFTPYVRFTLGEAGLSSTRKALALSPPKQMHYNTLSSNDPALAIHSRIIQPSDLTYNCQTKQWNLFGYPAVVSMSQGPQTEEEFSIQLCQGDQWACVLLGAASSLWMYLVTALILKRNEDNTYLRSGLLTAKLPILSWVGRQIKFGYPDFTREGSFAVDPHQAFIIR